MAKAKFTYDESGATFLYFVLSFLALVLFPSTYYFWPNEAQEDTVKLECTCPGCQNKKKQISDHYKWKRSRRKFIRILLAIGWLLFFVIAYKCATVQHEYVNWDPFEILGVREDASPKDIKTAYRKLSLIHHPDKGTGDADRFVQITKAYAALTDDEARKNWEQYGNPDGPGATSFGIALPSWIVEKENSFVVLGIYALVFMVALPVSVGLWWYKSVKYGSDKVLINTTELYYYFIHKTPNMAFKRVLMILAASLEFSKSHNPEVIERPEDNIEVPRLMRDLSMLNDKNKERPLFYSHSVKARAILHAHLSRMKLPQNTLEVDRCFIVRKCPYLIQEFVQCVAQLVTLALSGRVQNMPSLMTLENAMKACPTVVQALWEYQSPLLQLPHFTDETLRSLVRKKIKIESIEQLAKMEDAPRREALKNFSDSQYEEIMFVISKMPSLQMHIKFEVLDDEEPGLITAGAIVTVSVKLKRFFMMDKRTKIPNGVEDSSSNDNNNNSSDGLDCGNEKSNKGGAPKKPSQEDDELELIANKKQKIFSKSRISHTVHCPYFPDDKQEFWWVYVVDRKRFALVTAPLLVTSLVDTEDLELKFTAPHKPGTYTYTTVVRSDSYMDCTLQKITKVDVKPAKEYEEIPYEPSEEEDAAESGERSGMEDSDLVTDSDE